MTPIRLVTGEGKLVADLKIIPFRVMPDAIRWGARHFKFEFEATGVWQYREIFVYVVPDGPAAS